MLAERAQRVSRVGVAEGVGATAWLGAAFILSRATILAELKPFGAAIVMAVAGLRPNLLWPTVLSAGAGTAWSLPGPEGWFRLATFLGLGLTYTLCRRNKKVSRVPGAFIALGAAVVILIRGLGQVILGPTFYGWMLLIFEAILAAGLAMAWNAAVVSRYREEQLLGLGLFALGLLLGLQELKVGGMSVQSLIGRLFILLAALIGGAGAGAASGAVLGFLPSLTSLTAPALAGLLALVGLTAGAFYNLGKLGVVGGFLLAHLLLSGYFLGAEGANAALKESSLVALIALLLPREVLKQLSASIIRTNNESSVKEALGLSDRWNRVINALRRLGESLELGTQNDSTSVNGTLRQVERLVCQGCPAHKVCWELEGDKLREVLKDLLKKEGPVLAPELPEWLKGRCGKAWELAQALSVQPRGRALDKGSSLGLHLGLQFQALAQVLEETVKEASASDDEELQPYFTVEVGYASCARDRDLTCGDSFLAGPLDGGKYLLVLSDGMGAGCEARKESRTAVELLKDLLAAGFPQELALRFVNLVLLLRSPSESFATLDVAVLDLVQGRGEFLKLGACPTFLLRDNRVLTVRSQSLPVGILEDIPVETVEEELHSGDVLVMVSDGVLEAHKEIAEKERWLVAALKRAPDCHPQELADRLLKQAVALAAGRPADDMSIAVARIQAD
ncbi:MAG: SpoIIE family protein phosphatase [Thermanaeromonas sp.]|uniref:SpoIIE family protein phosphatase n=1 Tax=Thermanaeromonas sp. TaxID=2003697 RepID=UPI00243D4D33|nr:SpoIIE family protein phosphatase [Thermanaeromonas sp.]MCG0277688.1 SpoIIE family protein phosphatase [Thermanaeromonas sp.]